jgi:hypothetical protein
VIYYLGIWIIVGLQRGRFVIKDFRPGPAYVTPKKPNVYLPSIQRLHRNTALFAMKTIKDHRFIKKKNTRCYSYARVTRLH